MEIIYEDNHLLVLNKQAGLPTQPTPQERSNLEDQAKHWLKEKYQKPGNVFLHVIHRLDTPVSGIVVCAKTSKSLSRLQESIRKKETVKKYHALVEGYVNSEKKSLKHFLIHGEHKALESKEGKECVLHFKVLKRYPTKTLLEVNLDTGRYHQIRAQLSLIGHPIVGDKKYGSQCEWPLPGIALHHAEFHIKHPITGVSMIFTSSSQFSF